MTMKRDSFLDDLRVLATVWVLWVHVLYWMDFFVSGVMYTLKSFFLLEMPLFFFVTGAAQSLGKPRSWGEHICRSARRILIPYWCYGALCIVLLLLFRPDKAVPFGPMLLRWVIPFGKQAVHSKVLKAALWYVPVYLLSAAALPLLRRWKRRWFTVPLLAALTAVFAALGWEIGQQTAFYCIWIWAGLWYPELKERYILRKDRRWELLIPAAAGAAALAGLCMAGLCSPDMQQNKFPPNGAFGLYSLAAMSLLWLAAPLFCRVLEWLRRWGAMRRVLEKLGQYSLTVYLYQPLAVLGLTWLNQLPVAGMIPHSVRLVADFLLLVLLAAVLAAVFGPLERLGTRKKA